MQFEYWYRFEIWYSSSAFRIVLSNTLSNQIIFINKLFMKPNEWNYIQALILSWISTSIMSSRKCSRYLVNLIIFLQTLQRCFLFDKTFSFFFFFCTKSHGRFINIGWSKRKINFSKKKQQSLIWISINMCKTTFPFFKWLNGRKYDQLIRFCSSNFLYITKPKSVKNQFSFYS